MTPTPTPTETPTPTPTPTITASPTPTPTPTPSITASSSLYTAMKGFSAAQVAEITLRHGSVERYLRKRNLGYC